MNWNKKENKEKLFANEARKNLSEWLRCNKNKQLENQFQIASKYISQMKQAGNLVSKEGVAVNFTDFLGCTFSTQLDSAINYFLLHLSCRFMKAVKRSNMEIPPQIIVSRTKDAFLLVTAINELIIFLR